MFGSRAFSGIRGSGAKSLDVPVAALAGLSVAFLAFAMPAGLLGDLVVASGLPSLIAAAEPPLGFKARIGVGAAGAVAVFSITFLLLRWLDGFSVRHAEAAEDAAFQVEAPRVRRRDFHPDAPARPPLLAVHELGEPDLVLDQVAPAPRPLRKEPAISNPPPTWAEPPAPPTPEPEPHFARDFDPEPPRREPDADQAAAYALSQYRWSDEPPEPESPADDPWLAEPPAAVEPEYGDDLREPIAAAAPPEPDWSDDAPVPLDPTAFGLPQSNDGPPRPIEPVDFAEPQWIDERPEPSEAAVTQPEWSDEPPAPVEPVERAPIAEAEHEPLPAAPEPWPAERLPDIEPEPAAPPPQPGSIAELMERLEQGIARRRAYSPTPQVAARPVAEPATPAFPDPADDRLQSAIESLQRFASRQD